MKRLGRQYLLRFAMGATMAVLASGCGGGGGGDGGGRGGGLQPTLSSIQANIFTPRCTTFCHEPGGTGFIATSPRNLDLREGFSNENLVNVDSTAFGCGPAFDVTQPCGLKRVKPLDPDNSYIIWKLEKNSNMPLAEHQMPFGCEAAGNCLSQAEIDVVRQWISNGAPDN